MLTRVKVKNSKTKEESVINCGAAFVAIGHDPNTKFVKGQVDMDANGYIASNQAARGRAWRGCSPQATLLIMFIARCVCFWQRL